MAETDWRCKVGCRQIINTGDAMNIEIDFDRAEHFLGIISNLVAALDEKSLQRPDLVRILCHAPGILAIDLCTDRFVVTNAFDESFLEGGYFSAFLDHIVAAWECRHLEPRAVNGEKIRKFLRHPAPGRATDFRQVVLEDHARCIRPMI